MIISFLERIIPFVIIAVLITVVQVNAEKMVVIEEEQSDGSVIATHENDNLHRRP